MWKPIRRFPSMALVDLCLKAEDIAVHTEGVVRVTHPGHGMGLEFPSRTAEQRAEVGNLISLLRSFPESMLDLSISPRALMADLSQFEPLTRRQARADRRTGRSSARIAAARADAATG